jgi:hypothetical protein
MRCNDFDSHIDEMLSGVLHPDANQHMRQCERCTSHYRARATVQNGLRTLAAASATGPSRATDRAVMESYRRWQASRPAVAGPTLVGNTQRARLLTFPDRGAVAALAPRNWWGGAVAAAAIFGVLGSAVHLWNGRPTVSAPPAISAPAARQSSTVPPPASSLAAAYQASRHIQPRTTQGPTLATTSSSNAALSASASLATGSTTSQPQLLAATTSPVRPTVTPETNLDVDSAAVTQQTPTGGAVLRLASTGASGNVAQSASSTWPGYSNLMYCDPVVCSGPMQVVRIKVPVGEVKPNLGQTVGNTFVNAEVVIGPDGVARAIRVAN